MAAALALLAGGCGSASSTSASRSHATATAKGATARPAGTVIPPGSVAIVAGRPITQADFNHWMAVAARSTAAQTPGQPTIVPTDPPSFNTCIAQVRSHIPTLKKTAEKTLRNDCAQLYRSLSSEVMQFLITADWAQADATRLGVVPTDAQVASTLNTQRAKQFPNEKGYQAFLTKTGQTPQDLLLRFRINIILKRLIAREKGSATARENAVTKREKKLYAARTRCTPLVLMTDCGNYRAG